MKNRFLVLLSMALVLTAIVLDAPAATKEPPIHNTYYQIMSGAGKELERAPDRDTCVRRAQEIGRAAGETRTSGGNVVSCRAIDNFIFSYIPANEPPPVCGPVNGSPHDRACPNGHGTYSTTGTMGPPPACEVTWSTPKATDCLQPEPPVLPAPANLRTSAVSPTQLRIQWDRVTEAQSYELLSCRGATCTNLTRLSCLATNAYLHTLPTNATARYKVRASRATDCSNLGAVSENYVNGTTVSTTPTGAAALSWTPPTQNTDGTTLNNLAGYRIQYGRTCSTRDQVVQVPNAGATSHTVNGLASGEWCFAVRAYTSNGSESAESKTATKTVM